MTLRPFYNLVQLGLDEYEDNELIKRIRVSYQSSTYAFLKLCGINDYLLGTLQNHLHTEGLSEHIHGNIGRIPMTDNRVFLNSEITFPLKQFLVQYSCIHEHILLFIKNTKIIIHTEHDESNQIISYYTFRKLWIEMMPYLKFQAPASDLCEICEGFKAKIKVAKSDADEHEKVQIQYENHQKISKT
ncbi:unnamed protein product [Rhizophagus irregularis]|nr:unnamed protein product [Rhizophagus irregularis]